ncbi:beta family protein [Streptomyces lydicus]
MLVVYVPILKGKAGEFYALGHTSATVRDRIRPVMELVPDDELRDLLETFCDHAMNHVPNNIVLTVDCGALPNVRVLEGDIGGPVTRVSESLGYRDRPMCPVFRCLDEEGLLSEVADAAADHGQGACLRISTSVDTAEVIPDKRQMRELLASVRLDPGEIDLLVDAGPVLTGRTRERLTTGSVEALELLARWPWRSLCLASGAFPANLTGFPRGTATRVVREDARLWLDVVERWRGPQLDFGDFGVTYPRMPPKSHGTPHPNMRYTTETDWQVFVYPKVKAGNDDFFDLSKDLVNSPYWPAAGAATSWGDARLQDCAQGRREKAGGATEWRAWATSHHLAVVTTRLACEGCP